MATVTRIDYCSRCNDWVEAECYKPNTTIHAVLFILTLGLWFPIMILALRKRPYRCSVCGYKV